MHDDRLIDQILGREILDSRGNPTVEAEVHLVGGAIGQAAAPAGASTGRHEAVERRDGDPSRYRGRGVREAVRAIEEQIAAELIGEDAEDQPTIDRLLVELDGTPDRSELGANAILAVSLANARAAADAVGMPLYRWLGGTLADALPIPFLNVLNGGAHADNQLRVQEFMIAPLGFSRFSEALEAAVSVHRALGDVLRERGLATAVGDEGGYAPALDGAEAALDLLMEAIAAAGFEAGRNIGIALDVAASEFCRDGAYLYEPETSRSAADMIRMYGEWAAKYPVISIEDGLGEDDWQGWAELREALGDRMQLVGDDLFVTGLERLERGIRERAANALLVKPNQVGTLSETLAVTRRAQEAGFGTMLSHRSGDTADTAIAHIAVATGAGQIKSGAPCRGERVEKYNELLRIEEDLGDRARLARLPGT